MFHQLGNVTIDSYMPHDGGLQKDVVHMRFPNKLHDVSKSHGNQ